MTEFVDTVGDEEVQTAAAVDQRFAVVPGYEVVSWLGLAAPVGLPADIADKLANAVAVAVARPDVKARLEGMGNEARASTPAVFRARVETDYAKWKPLAKFVTP